MSAGVGTGLGTLTLAADIGGTKCLFGLFDGNRLVFERRLASADFSDFSPALDTFLKLAGNVAIAQACLAIAGPIGDSGRHARLTNLPWQVDAAALEREFKLPHITLANDFAAAALGAVTSAPHDLVTLQQGETLAAAPRLVVGAGTGLGMAVVLPEGKGWRLMPSEGGHVAFAPADAQQAALWSFLQQRHDRVTWERVVSGPGLAAIHEFITGEICPADAAGEPALTLFLSTYGAFAGDMALATLARGGVYLAGGIATEHQPKFASGNFLAAFNAKAEHADIAARMPIHIATDPAIGLRGARLLAQATIS